MIHKKEITKIAFSEKLLNTCKTKSTEYWILVIKYWKKLVQKKKKKKKMRIKQNINL